MDSKSALDSWARDYDELKGILLDLESSTTPSELHGMLSGQVCCGVERSAIEWLKEFLANNQQERQIMRGDEPVPAVTLSEQDIRVLTRFYELVVVDLESEEMRFSPLLPDDEHASLNKRLSALAAWAQGFLMGIGTSMSNVDSDDESAGDKGGKDRREVLSDLVEISQVDPEVHDNEENEKYYYELVEHLRVIAFTLREGALETGLN